MGDDAWLSLRAARQDHSSSIRLERERGNKVYLILVGASLVA